MISQGISNFSPSAIKLAKDCIKNATKIYFSQEYIQNDVHYGHLLLTCPYDCQYDLTGVLLEHKQIIIDEKQFEINIKEENQKFSKKFLSRLKLNSNILPCMYDFNIKGFGNGSQRYCVSKFL